VDTISRADSFTLQSRQANGFYGLTLSMVTDIYDLLKDRDPSMGLGVTLTSHPVAVPVVHNLVNSGDGLAANLGLKL